MIIDTHTHFYDPSRPQGVPWPAPDSGRLYRTVLPGDFGAVAAPCGVTGTVVVEASAWLEDNQWILDLAADEPLILGLVGDIAPGRPGFAADVHRFAANPLFRGIRVGGRCFEEQATCRMADLRADLEELARLDLELDVLISKQHLPALCALACDLPQLCIVINHIAHVPIDGREPDPEWLAGIQEAASCPRIYMKVSAVLEQSRKQPAPADPAYYAPTLAALWRAFGEDRLMYGSNWPVCERAGEYATAFSVVRDSVESKGARAARKFWWQNACAAYGLESGA